MDDRPTVPAARPRRGTVLGLASALVPGLGQLLGRRIGVGLALLAVWVIPAAAGMAVIVRDGAPDIGSIADSSLLAAIVVANAVVLLVRAVAAFHAPSAGRAPSAVGWLAVALAVVALGAANGGVAWYAWQGYDTVTTVFAEAEPDVAEPVGGGVLGDDGQVATDGGGQVATDGGGQVATDGGGQVATDGGGQVATDGGGQVATDDGGQVAMDGDGQVATTGGGQVATDGGQVATTAPAPTARLEQSPAPAGPPWRRRGRVTMLLLGGDAGYGRSGLRTDSMIVVTLDLKTGFSALFSVPRNTERVPLRGVLAEQLGPVFEPILNELYGAASGHPEWFPRARDPGAAALKQTLADLTGLPIDYYVLVDLKGFYEVVRAFGGVEVVVPEPVLDRVSPPEPEMEWIRIDLQPGLQHLDAAQTFAYVRARSESSDWSRIRRQRCVLAALAADATPRKVLRILPSLLGTLRDNVTTDIPRGVLPDLVELAAGLDRRHVLSFGFVPPDFTVGGGPDVAAIQALVRSVVEHPAGRPFESAAGDACLSA